MKTTMEWLYRLALLGMVGFACVQLWKIHADTLMISFMLDRLR